LVLTTSAGCVTTDAKSPATTPHEKFNGAAKFERRHSEKRKKEKGTQ